MSSVFTFIIFLLYFLPPINGSSCPTSKFSCGNFTMDLNYPFYSNYTSPPNCGLYLVQCLNQIPMIRFFGQEFLYPVVNISYDHRILLIHDLKLSISPYPWGSSCVFLYDFTAAPIPNVNVTQLSLMIINNQFLFDCLHGSHGNIFDDMYKTSLCKDYDLYYTPESNSRPSANCSSSGSFWFDWKLSFNRDNGNLSLLSVGFSQSWDLQPDCFSCRIAGENCSPGGEGGSSCECNEECDGGDKTTGNIIAVVVSAVGGFIFACALSLYCYRRKKRRQVLSSTPLFGVSSIKNSFGKDLEFGRADYQTHIFSYSELQDATHHFDSSQELGDGGFGTVYKGKLRDGRTVAVKRLYDNNYKRVEQFINEVAILSNLRHQNLVTLYGCTSHQTRELLLVYEFVANGTLADHLHGPRAPERLLTWPLRMRAAIETAEALAYLHAVEPPIIHRDVKTNNILLDESFHVKVADFGLSRLVPADATHVSTAPQGTPGYLDPEYHQCYQLTDKSDVYSFGVVLVELISSKTAVDVNRGRNEINLATMALSRIQRKELDGLVDPELGYHSDLETKRMILVVAELAFRCLQMDRDMRPPIKEVLDMLRDLQSGECKGAGVGEADDRRDVVGLLRKSSLSFSPDSTEKWSRSSTSNSSG